MAEYLPRGPLAAYLGVRNSNENANLQQFGLMQKFAEMEQARQLNEQFRRDQLGARTEAVTENRLSREAMAAAQREHSAELARQRTADAEANDRRDAANREAMIRLSAQLRPPPNQPAPHTVISPWKQSSTGYGHFDTRSMKFLAEAPAPTASARREEQTEQRGAMADYATMLTDRLNTLVTDNPRSATGIFAPLVRATEAVVNSVAPGTLGSQATISAQSKEQLITVLSQIRGGGMGRLSNQDMRRVDTAIGQINSGTQEGMLQGLTDTYDLIDALQGKPPRSNVGKTRPIARPAPPPGFKLDQ